MIDVLVQGRLHRAAQQRTSKTGSPFVTATVRVPTKDGGSLFASVICFSTSACQTLLALGDGDPVALSGEATIKLYQPKDGGEPRPSLDLLAHAVLSPYHVKRRREAIAGEHDERQPEQSTEPAAAPAHEEQSDDSIPF
jgi:hypothetical protein